MPKSHHLATHSCGSSMGSGSSAGGLCLRWKRSPDPSTSAFGQLEKQACSLAASNRLRVRVAFLNKNQPSPTATPPTNIPLGWGGDGGFSRPPEDPFPAPNHERVGRTESGCGHLGSPRYPRRTPGLCPLLNPPGPAPSLSGTCHLSSCCNPAPEGVSVPQREAFSVLYVGTRQTGCGLVF